MRLGRISSGLLFAGAIFMSSGCERAKKTVHWPGSAAAEKARSPANGDEPTADDMRVAREVMTIADVLAMLKANVPKEKIVEEVKRRRLPQVLVEAGELELAANGAGRFLIAELKNPQNTLTKNQDIAYSQVLTERFSQAKKPGKP